MLKNDGRISCPTFFANVCPSVMSFCRCPSARWPKTSWKKTAAARPVSSAGPTVGSMMGAFTSPSSSLRRVADARSEEHTSELQSQFHLVCRLLLEKKNNNNIQYLVTKNT